MPKNWFYTVGPSWGDGGGGFDCFDGYNHFFC